MAETRRPRGGYYPGDWVRPRPNPGGWTPIADTQEIHTGNRSTNRAGTFELYDAPIGVRLRVEQAAKSAPFLLEGGSGEDHMKPVRAWREGGALYALYDANGSILLARSEDGHRWQQVERVTARGGDQLKAVFEDPTAPPEERFKGMGCDGGWYDPDAGTRMDTGGEGGANEEAQRRWEAQEYQGPAYRGPRVELRGEVIGWTSPDRRRWRTLDEPIAPFPMDGGLSAGYDAATGHYFAYCRVHGMELPAGAAPGVGSGSAEVGLVRRAIGLTRTRDFRSWPPPKLILAPDGQDGLDVSFYGCDYFPYPGSPNGARDDLHCMLIQVYHQATDHVDSQIAFSRDGLFWHRPERRPIIPLGAPGEGDSGMVYSWGCGLIELPDGSWGSLYAGSSWLHNAGRPADAPPAELRWATWRPHRLCGVEAPVEGRFTIPTVYRTRDELRLNYRCRPGGWVSVELLHAVPSRIHADVEPVAGFTFTDCGRLTGDAEDALITWNGRSDISPVGEMVGIRLRLFQATVFAYAV